jgi:hypothetical protein
VKAKVLPRPGSLSTVICPPIRATSRAAIDASAVLSAIRRESPSCVSVVNANLLRIARTAGDAEHDQRDTQRKEVAP